MDSLSGVNLTVCAKELIISENIRKRNFFEFMLNVSQKGGNPKNVFKKGLFYFKTTGQAIEPS